MKFPDQEFGQNMEIWQWISSVKLTACLVDADN